jgi:hypothetical protein
MLIPLLACRSRWFNIYKLADLQKAIKLDMERVSRQTGKNTTEARKNEAQEP